jgi:uncharacterized protein YbcV (DUF1398 family)
MDAATIQECSRMSFADTPFPQVAERLAGGGVRAYRVDLIRLRSDYYGEVNDSYESALPLRDGPAIATEFQEADVVAAVRAIQRSEIGYAEFLRRIMRAGCAHYSVYFRGRKVVYVGRDGQSVTENFPVPN